MFNRKLNNQQEKKVKVCQCRQQCALEPCDYTPSYIARFERVLMAVLVNFYVELKLHFAQMRADGYIYYQGNLELTH